MSLTKAAASLLQTASTTPCAIRHPGKTLLRCLQSVILLRTTQAKLDQHTVDELKANSGLRSEIWDLFRTGMCCAQTQTNAQTLGSLNSSSLPSSSIHLCHANLCITTDEPVMLYIRKLCRLHHHCCLFDKDLLPCKCKITSVANNLSMG